MASQEATSQVTPLKVVVASLNPVKTGAVLEGFSRMFPGSAYQVSGVSVPSGVPEQPLSDQETLQGALNRIQNARSLEPDADFWVGVEGGVHPDGETFQSFAWIAVENKEGRTGKARTATYYLAQETANLIGGGMELGHADDLIFGKTNSKQHSGSVGILTDDVVTRTSYYVQAVILALIPFKNTQLTFRTGARP
ncbi:inosine triphosphate pyrophosphatase-like protein [Triangularia verruculosa]|uniref:inosine/xanthosine triphosphatase n=1 Tax=Triangularia verruculosa TaxID=2587418 RepID=A0AAN6XG93_9PEZI|nr:inosine triphosphate pyrophosphatase-like protein [Triangularia verruculosa]